MRERKDALRVTAPGLTLTLDARRSAVTVGRDPGCDIPVDDERISRRHVVIRLADGGWVLEDQRSKNGVFRAGERVRKLALSEPMTVLLGDPVDGFALELAPVHDDGAAVSVVHRPERAVTTIGRAPDNDIVVDDLLVSRHHAELRVSPGPMYEIVDLGSHNGTFLNGKPVNRARLEPLDVVSVGHHLFRLVEGALEEYVETGDITFEATGLRVTAKSGEVLLDGVSFSLPQRGFLAVVGPSGAGKTTLLNAITGFRPAEQGSVLYDGRDMYASFEELRRRIGFVPQDDVVHPQLTVRRALEFGAELRFPPDVDRDTRLRRVDEVIGELGLTPRRDLQIAKLSGGQRKRTSVALELLTRPSLLFLDEPTSGLDPGYERNLMELLRGLADGGRTVVVVTHSVASLRLCDRVLVLAPGGRLAYFGPPQLAPAYFERDDFQEIFQDLTDQPDRDWAEEFHAHPDYEQYVLRPAGVAEPAVAAEREPPPPPRQHESLRQLSTLTRRYLRVLVSDRRTLPLLLLQAPVIGLLMLFVLPRHELRPPASGQLRILSRGAAVIFQVVLISTWLGLSNAIREIVKERAIYRRERNVGLSAWAYLSSKVLVLSGFTIIQAAVLVGLATAAQGGPKSANVLGWPLGELMLAGALAGLAAMALGLFVSSAVRSVDAAITLLPVLLVFENVLAMGGTFPEVVHKPVLQQLTYVASSQYAFAAAASTADLNRLQSITNVVRKLGSVDLSNPTRALPAVAARDRGEHRYDHTPRIWWLNVLALLGLTMAGLVGAGMLLDRRARDGP